jgi:hypothetical protein
MIYHFFKIIILVFSFMQCLKAETVFECFDEKNYDLSASLTATSEATFRGKKQSQEALQSHIRLQQSLPFGAIYGQIWAHMPFSENPTLSTSTNAYSKTNNEIDFTIGYQMPIGLPPHGSCHATEGILTLDIGYTYYDYPQKATYYTLITPKGTFGLDHSHECFLGIKGNVIGDPQFYGYYDVKRQQCVFQFSLGHQIPVTSLEKACPFWDQVIFDMQFYGGYLTARDYLGDTTRFYYNQAYPQNPYPKWHNHYYYWGIDLGYLFQINDYCGYSIAIHYTGNTDGSSKFGPDRAIQPNMGDHSQFINLTAGFQLQF